MFTFRLLFILLLPVICFGVGRVRDRIYTTLKYNHQCFRILNGTHQAGCQSKSDGSNGIFHFIENDEDIDYVLRDPGGHAPFIVAMKMKLFRNKTIVMKLHNSDKLSGMVLIQETDKSGQFDPSPLVPSFSEDSTCPNQVTSLYKDDKSHQYCKNQTWNTAGTDYRFTDFKMPIFLINTEAEIDILINKCYEKFNKPVDGKPPKYPLCYVSLTLFNIGAGDAVRCKRRNGLISGLDVPTINCDNLTGANIFGFIPATNKSQGLAPDSVLMLATRMDSMSMFSDYDPGTVSSLSNVIAMLAIAEALGRNKEFIKNSSLITERYLMPMFFDGEAFDYIGSSRVAWDMSKNEFPRPLSKSLDDQPALLSFDNLALILELNQLASPGSGGYFLHVDPNSTTNDFLKNASGLLSKYSDGVIKGSLPTNSPLPPSSVQSFLKLNRSIPALVITDHEKEFRNKFYNSFMDEPFQVDRKELTPKLIKLTNGVLKFVFDWVSKGNTPDDWQVNVTMLNRLMDCFWSWPKWKCDVFDRVFKSVGYPKHYVDDISSLPYKRTYISVYRRGLIPYVNYSLAYFLGTKYPLENSTRACESKDYSNRTGSIYKYYKMLDLFDNSTNYNDCFITSVDATVARSPAFEIEGYDLTSGKYSSWMESRWEETDLKVFLRTDPMWESAVLVVGLLVGLLSLIIVYLIASGSDILFTSTEITAL